MYKKRNGPNHALGLDLRNGVNFVVSDWDCVWFFVSESCSGSDEDSTSSPLEMSGVVEAIVNFVPSTPTSTSQLNNHCNNTT